MSCDDMRNNARNSPVLLMALRNKKDEPLCEDDRLPAIGQQRWQRRAAVFVLLFLAGFILLNTLLRSHGAHAAEPRSIEWFIMHNQERAAMLGCDLKEIECNNAIRADRLIAAADAQLAVQKGDLGVGSTKSPLFYDAFPIARRQTLRDCANPSAVPQLFRSSEIECRAARISAARNGG